MAPSALLMYVWATRVLVIPVLAWLWWRGRREPGYRDRWRERLGWAEVSPSHMGAVWLHAASVGEVQAAQPLIERLLATGLDHELVVSTHTPTGAQALRARWANVFVMSMPRWTHQAPPSVGLSVGNLALWCWSSESCGPTGWRYAANMRFQCVWSMRACPSAPQKAMPNGKD